MEKSENCTDDVPMPEGHENFQEGAIHIVKCDDPCPICRERSDVWDRVTIATCGHQFCAKCILSWAGVREECALCRAPFTSVLVRRDLSGEILSTAVEESIALLRRAKWTCVQNVSPFNPFVDDFAQPPADATFGFVPRQSTHVGGPSSRTTTPAPYYQSEEVEDALERMFWDEEEKRFQQRMPLMGNRRHGPNGYVRAGRRLARATNSGSASRSNRSVQSRTTSQSATTPSTSNCGTVIQNSNNNNCNNSSSCTVDGEVRGKRKKKTKKKSRAGMAAAAARAAAEAARASQQEHESEPGTDNFRCSQAVE